MSDFETELGPTAPLDTLGTRPTDEDPWGYGYAAHTSSATEENLQVGMGVGHTDNVELLNATGQLGFFGASEGAGTQVGAKGEANSIGVGGSLGQLVNAATLGQVPTTAGKQGGWENFLSGEVHGPRASGELSAGETGFNANAGAELGGGSAKLGGAEYDYFFGGTEISVGGAAGGVGAGFGLSWSDDDGDGYKELGMTSGIELGIGADIGVKTEALGHVGRTLGLWDAPTVAPKTPMP